MCEICELKQKIEILYDDSAISKQYHPDCVPEMEEDDEYE